LFTDISFSQTQSDWFPSELNIQSFTANFLEPRAGFQYLFDLDKVQINIGTSHDIIHFISEGKSFSIGADFFTYTRARKENNFKFPVETIDYLFGINSSYKQFSENSEWGVRLRFSHISAHLVDGSFNNDSDVWDNEKKPFTFSKEFIELFPYYRMGGLRIYGGITYIFHVIPDEIRKEIFQIGFDYYSSELSTETFTPFIAYDFKLAGREKFSGSNSITAGIKFGKSYSRGFSIFTGYFSGKSNHGELFDQSEEYITIGINSEI
jgi:hypothetical protein